MHFDEESHAAPIELDPSDPYRRLDQTFPTLTADQLERLKRHGTVESYDKGTVLYSRGSRSVDFFAVLSGNVEIYEDHYTAECKFHTVMRIAPAQFTGELTLFNSREILLGARMETKGQVLRIARRDFRKLLA